MCNQPCVDCKLMSLYDPLVNLEKLWYVVVYFEHTIVNFVLEVFDFHFFVVWHGQHHSFLPNWSDFHLESGIGFGYFKH